MRPPQANGATVHSGWPRAIPVARPRLRAPRLRAWGIRTRLAVLSVVVMATSLAAVAVVDGLAPGDSPAGATPSAGTAFLGTTTCADWRDAGVARRLVIVRMLAVAATQPDPEIPGATLSNGAAYGLFQRICSGSASGSTLLYESSNRAASFQSVRGGSPAVSGSFGAR